MICSTKLQKEKISGILYYWLTSQRSFDGFGIYSFGENFFFNKQKYQKQSIWTSGRELFSTVLETLNKLEFWVANFESDKLQLKPIKELRRNLLVTWWLNWTWEVLIPWIKPQNVLMNCRAFSNVQQINYACIGKMGFQKCYTVELYKYFSVKMIKKWCFKKNSTEEIINLFVIVSS